MDQHHFEPYAFLYPLGHFGFAAVTFLVLGPLVQVIETLFLVPELTTALPWLFDDSETVGVGVGVGVGVVSGAGGS